MVGKKVDKVLWPTHAPGMPPVGEDFINEAVDRGDTVSCYGGKGKAYAEEHGEELKQLLWEALYGRGSLFSKFTIKGPRKESFPVLAGHKWCRDPDDGSPGPEPSRIMIISKNLGGDDVSRRRHQIGPIGNYFLGVIGSMDIKPGGWYITSVLKTEHLESDRGEIKSGWVKNQLHLLHQEIRLVKPDYILCLGKDAIKALLGKNMSVAKMEGRVEEVEFDFRKSADEPENKHTVKVMASIHPAYSYGDREQEGRLRRSLRRLQDLVDGERWDLEERGIDHRVVNTERDLIKLCKEMEGECGQEGLGKIIGVDAEWHGDHPQNEGAYLRCVQLSWAHKKAAAIVLHEAGGKPGFLRYVRDKRGRIQYMKRNGHRVARVTRQGGLKRCMQILTKFMKDKRPSGHQFCSDLEWLIPAGLDLRDQCQAPLNWQDCLYEGGLDTAYMAHAVDETADFTLTGQTLRYTEAPRYDMALVKWKERYCSEHKIKASHLEGFGDCPDEVLYPYAIYDADVTRRICLSHMRNLTCDQFGNNCWEAFWINQRAALPVLEIDMTGILLDKERVDALTECYLSCRQRLGEEIREWANWPALNLESPFEVAELLFGEKYNNKEVHDDGTHPRLRPRGAKVVGTLPLLSTDKRPVPWVEVMERNKEDEYNASTKGQVLGMLLNDAKKLRVWRRTTKHPEGTWVRRDCSDIIGVVRNYRFISQILKSVLRPPAWNEAEGGYMLDEDDHFLFTDGMPGQICTDQRIRTFISQLKETGRWSSARPPLQNLSKRREPDYKKILKDDYLYPLRSILMADKDWVLVEADYVGAELYGMAIMSQDKNMIDHATRNQLPDDHPDFYDIHSNVAVMAFGYDCEPTKAGLKLIEKSHMRIVAKSVIFGIAYGRGAKAIAIAAKEEGVDITEEEAQQVIDAVFKMYPGLVDFFAECRQRAASDDKRRPAPRWLCGPFGRFRRFAETFERKSVGDIERQAQNFPIQGMIADVVGRAIDHVYTYREEHPELTYKIVLQIHDAVVLLVHKSQVARVIDEVLPVCMVDKVPIHPCSLDGMPLEGVPVYRLGIDTEIATHWGVHMMPDECWRMGINPTYAGWKKVRVPAKGYTSSSFPAKLWHIERESLVSLEEAAA